MKNFFEFFFWIILGGLTALVFALYEMLWLSPRGEDKVSEMRRNMIK